MVSMPSTEKYDLAQNNKLIHKSFTFEDFTVSDLYDMISL